MRAIDWSNIYRKYKGSWVALDNDEVTVVGHGRTAKEALARAGRKGYERPILTHLPKDLVTYVGGWL